MYLVRIERDLWTQAWVLVELPDADNGFARLIKADEDPEELWELAQALGYTFDEIEYHRS